MNRNQFLSNIWSPYPSAGSDWKDLDSWLSEGGPISASGAVVCGRIFLDGSGALGTSHTWRLKSGTTDISIQISNESEWLLPQKNNSTLMESPKSLYDILSNGDIVAVRIQKKANFDCWLVDRVLLLAPALRDFQVNSNFSIERSQLWANFLGIVREFFNRQGFTEVATPTLVASPGTEPYLDPFTTTWQFGSHQREFYLPTSPEFHLKKMLVQGWSKVFEFKPCFRNAELSEHHQPEFWMLEWYRSYSNLDAIADDIEALITNLSQALAPGRREFLKLTRTTVADLFAIQFSGFKLKADSTLEELGELARKSGIRFQESDSWDDLFHRLFLEKIEPDLGKGGPILVRGYPPSQAALSRMNADGFADRFEVYWRGLEIANAFHELNDPVENENRFKKDAEIKSQLGKPPVAIDQELVEFLQQGMPPSGGIALGLDRLFMALFEIDQIAATRAFPINPLY